MPGPKGEVVDDLLRRARAGLERADRAVAAALAGPAADRARALLAVLADCPGHPGATAALAQIPVAAPAWVSAARDARGDVLVLWAASTTPDVTYRVSRQRPGRPVAGAGAHRRHLARRRRRPGRGRRPGVRGGRAAGKPCVGGDAL